MRIELETRVEQDYLTVKSGFDERLFRRLLPTFPPVKLLRFDGSRKGDLITLEMNFLFFRQMWTSEITEDVTTEQEFYFVDQGVVLPFFLQRWTHKHRVISSGVGSIIRDEIEFEAPFSLASYVLLPLLWMQFALRRPGYRRYFIKPAVG
jgi:ligand-binding SRPBCC domain-containing protein